MSESGFKKVAGSRKYFKYQECSKGQKLVSAGVYVGPEEGKFGTNHVFRQDDSQVISLNSSGHLNWLLENYATPGKTICNVIYDGKEVLQKGAMKGKEAHRFELEVKEPDAAFSVVASPGAAPLAVPVSNDLPDISL